MFAAGLALRRQKRCVHEPLGARDAFRDGGGKGIGLLQRRPEEPNFFSGKELALFLSLISFIQISSSR